MAKFILTTIGTHGDINPFIAIGRELKARHHDILFISHCHYQQICEESGFDFAAIDTPDEFEKYLEDGPMLNNLTTVPEFLKRHLMPKMMVIYHHIQAHHHRQHTILVTRSTPGVAARMASEKLHIPLALVSLSPSYLTNIALIETLMGTVFADEINQHRQQVGLAPINDWHHWIHSSHSHLALWPSWFGDENPPMPVTTTGFVSHYQPSHPETLPSVDDFLAVEPSPILITGGTGTFTGKKFYEASVQACQQLGYRALLVTRHQQLIPDPLPDTVQWVPFIPNLARFMPRVQAIIHHGGIGTIADALAAAIPQVVLALGSDRPDNAVRLQRLGVGQFLPMRQWTKGAVAEALQQLLTNTAVLNQCHQLAAQLRQHNPLVSTCDLLETFIPKSGSVPASLATSATVPTPMPKKTDNKQDKLTTILNKLPPEKRKLLVQKLKLKQKKVSTKQTIMAQPRRQDNVVPLSYAQERLWFLYQLDPLSSAYNAPTAMSLTGPIDPQLLEKSLNRVMQRHEALRTTFATENGRSVGMVQADVSISMPIIDLRALTKATQKVVSHKLLVEEGRQLFDLESGPLLRAKLLQLAEATYLLLMTIHHIAFDGWSRGVIIHELLMLYDAFQANKAASLPPLPIQYADFAAWQRQQLSEAALAKQISYWKEALHGAPALLTLRNSRPRPEAQTFRGAHYGRLLSASLHQQIKTLSQQAGCTLFMTLLTVYFVILHHYSGDKDIVVGTDVANRTQPETHGLVGFFVNQLALRVNWHGDPTFRELLQQVRKVALGAYANQDLPFDRLVQALRPERTLKHQPIFQVKCIVQNVLDVDLNMPNVVMTPVRVDWGVVQTDLSFEIEALADGLMLWIEYSTDLFEETDIAQMLSHVETILQQVVAAPERHLQSLTTQLQTIEQQQQAIKEKEAEHFTLKRLQRIKGKRRQHR